MFLVIPVMSANASWTQVNESAGWSVRGYFSSVVLPDNSIVLMGGCNDKGYSNETWKSADNGATWSQVSPNAGWTGRCYHNSVALPDGSIVLIGGEDGRTRNDVWRSTNNGTTWTEVNASTGWTPRESLSSAVMPDGSIIVSGGTLPGGYVQFSDVWRSIDKGTTWTKVTADAGWSPRYGHGMVALSNGTIVITGGYTFGPTYSNETWRSEDYGATWTRVNASSGWSKRYFSSMVSMPDRSIVLLGGGNNEHYTNDTWQSKDSGTTWNRIDASAGWTARMGQNSVGMPDGSIVLMGGYDGSYRNDVWRRGTFKSSDTD
ncbi:MAG: sialidase family protein [Methanoregula sp.]